MASTASVAAAYHPLTGLITDNNYDQYTKAAGGVSGGGSKPSFTNPNAPTTPATTGAPGSIGGVGAYTPDWKSLIEGDAGFKDAAAALAAGGAQNKAALDAQITNAYESFGDNVDLAKLAQSLGMTQADLQNTLTPDVQRLASENTSAGLSTKARLEQENQKQMRSILANLNKRGILHSGEAGYELDQQNLGYRQANSDAYQKFLGYLQQYQQGFTSAQQANAGQLAQAYSGAADRQYSVNQGSAGVTAYETSPGSGIYKGPDGKLYGKDGTPYVPPQASAPAPGTFSPVHGLIGV